MTVQALVSGTSDLPKICIDGPYGAASQDHSKYEILLLIGLGIGATPFISILKDIANGLKKVITRIQTIFFLLLLHILILIMLNTIYICWWISQVDSGEARDTEIPRKAYFYWVTREQGSFEWFRDIMKDVSALDEKHVREDINLFFLTHIWVVYNW